MIIMHINAANELKTLDSKSAQNRHHHQDIMLAPIRYVYKAQQWHSYAEMSSSSQFIRKSVVSTTVTSVHAKYHISTLGNECLITRTLEQK